MRLTASPEVVRRMGQPQHPVVRRQGQPAARRPHPPDRWASGLAVGGDELLVAREGQFRAHLGPRHPYHEVCARRAIWCAHVSPPGPPAPRHNAMVIPLGSQLLALTLAAFPWLAGTVGVALTTCTCFAVLRAVSAALRRPDEGEQAGYGLRDGPRRRRRLMGWEGGYFLRSEIKKEGMLD